jgi:parallel beta-helix repeat protein
MLSTYTANSTNDTQKLISNWGTVQNVPSSVDSIGDAGGGGGDLYLYPLWFKNATIIMDYVEPSGEGGSIFWESELYYNDSIGWYGSDSTVFINGTGVGVSNSIYWNWYHDGQYGIMGAGSVQIPNTGESDTQHYNVYFVYSPDGGTTWELANGTTESTPISCSSLLIDNTKASNPSMSIMNSCPILDENGNIIIATSYFAYPTYSTCFGYQLQWAMIDYYNTTPGSSNGVWSFQNITDAQSGNLIQGYFSGYCDSVGIIKDGYYGRPAFWVDINGSQIYYVRVPNSISSFLAVVTDTSQPYCFCEPDGIFSSDTDLISSWEWSLTTRTMPAGNSSEPYGYDQDLSSSTIYGCIYTATASSTISEGSFYAYVPLYMEGCNYQIAVYAYNGTYWNWLGNSDCSKGLGSGYIYCNPTSAWTGWAPPVSFSTPISLVSGTQYLICLYLNYMIGSTTFSPTFVYDDSTTVNQTIAFSTSNGFPSTITSPTYRNWSWGIALFTSCCYLEGFCAPHAISILSPQNTTYNVTPVKLTFTVDESTSWIGYSLDNQPNVTISGNTTLEGLSVGQHSINVFANDTFGNIGSSDVVSFTIMQPRTIIVPDDYSSIQAAINAAGDGDTIFVRDGTYSENVVVNKTLALLGENAQDTIINGSVKTAVAITSKGVNITGFTIATEDECGILLYSNYSIVSGNNVTGNYEGIELEGSCEDSISGNYVANNYVGIYLDSSSDNNSASGDNMTSNGYGVWISSSSNNSISENNITTNSYYGVYSTSSSGNGINENNIANNYYGIALDSSSNCSSISGNNITNNDYGIYFYSSFNDNIVGNNITANEPFGIFLDYSSKNSMRENNIVNNYDGIWLEFSSNNSISENKILISQLAVSGLGIWVDSSSNYNGISGNSIINNDHGLYVGSSLGNEIYHNNFINNTSQVYSYQSISAWDDGYPSGGNYWSDYTGVDVKSGPYQNLTGSDGIGDTPYVIDANNTDNYPLMEPFPLFHDVAVTNVTSKTVVFQGYNLNINVTAADLGNYTETFNVTVYANTTIIASQNVTLQSGGSTTLTFAWNTTGFAKGSYTIRAYAWPVPDETNSSYNNFTDGVVYVSMVGDLTGASPFVPDGKCDGRDITVVAKCFGSHLGDARYNPNCDIFNRGRIDGRDLTIVAKNFGKQDP